MTGILELKLMAREKGVKGFSSMSKKELCRAMGISYPERQIKVELTSIETGEVLRFVSTHKASKELKVNPGIFYNYTKRARAGGATYHVKLFNYTKRT